MSDHEFDTYLALLSRLLRLDGKQKGAIAGELRAHLEDRLDELLARGVPRDEAVRQALEELGDAAGLAAEFVSLSGNNRKRWLMRLTTASVAAIVLIAAGIFTFWPGNNGGPGAATLVAQNPGSQSAPAASVVPMATPVQTLENKLNEPIDADFIDTPLREAIQFLQSKSGIQFILKSKKLEEAGASGDVPVSISLKSVRLRTLLDLLLEPLELTYMTEDGLVLITTPEDAESPDRMIVRVYDCRELLALPRPPGSTRHKATGGGGFFAIQDQPPAKAPVAGGTSGTVPAGDTAPAADAPAASAPSSSGGEGVGSSGRTVEGPIHPEISDSQNLIDVITTIVDPESWVDVGGPGGIAEYKGLLSVATTQDVHEKVERLLNMLHQAAGTREPRIKVVE